MIYFEKERKNIYKIVNPLEAIFFVVFLYEGCISILARLGYVKSGLFDFLLCLACFVFAFFVCTVSKDFENKIKIRIMKFVCECFGNMRWSNTPYTSTSIFQYSHLIPKWTSYSNDDVFKGTYNDVKYEIIESCFIKGSGRYQSTLFQGVIVKLEMNKNFKGNTVILPERKFHNSPSFSLKHTILEDVEFEKKHDVYTDDEVEARYLITPSFMERLNNMQVAFTANDVICAFYNKHLLIGLSTAKDLFSLGSLSEPVDDKKQFFTMFEEMLSIIKLIDHFKLYQKIGM